MGYSFVATNQSSRLTEAQDAGRNTQALGAGTATPPIAINPAYSSSSSQHFTPGIRSGSKSQRDAEDTCQTHQRSATTKTKTSQLCAGAVYKHSHSVACTKDDFNRKSNFYSLVANERQSLLNAEQTDEDFQEICVHCYPLACRNRICCRQHERLRVSDVRSDSPAALHYRCSSRNSGEAKLCPSCRCNNCCSRVVSIHCQKHKATIRNAEPRGPHERPSKMGGCHAPPTYLRQALAGTCDSLTANAVQLKNAMAEVIGGNCATLVAYLTHSGRPRCDPTCDTSNNKSEPYWGCRQRKHELAPPYFPSHTSTNSYSYIEAIRSSPRELCSSSAANRAILDSSNKNNSNHNCHTRSAASGTTAAASAADATPAAAFNYIGHNYYHFLRNSINFYTASSVILVLCYLTTTTSAATTKSDSTSVDKHPIFDESSSDKEILDMLLEKKRYDKRLLPPVHDEDFCCGLSSPDMATEQTRRQHRRGTLTVNVNVLLLSLASPDESSLKYEVEFLLHQQWNDPRLEYGNKSGYPFLNALHHHDSIWTPDTYFIMHGDFKDPIIPMHFALRIFRNGTIMYAMRRHLILSCQGSLHIFPFDDPKCSFSMESISYEESQIKYVWRNDEDTLRKSPSLTTLNAYLIKNQTTACDQNSWRGNYSCLQVELTFTRDRAYYFTTVFIPGIILVTSSFITFWLEWNAVPARVMIGVTTMLNFFTTSNGFRSTLPVVSNLTAMNVWDGVCMCFIYASLLEFVCVNYMGRKRPQHNVVYRPGENPVTQRLPAVLSRIGVILASPLEIIEREFNAAMSSEKAATGTSSGATSIGVSPRPGALPHEHISRVHFELEGGIIATAVQSLRARSIKRRNVKGSMHEWTRPPPATDSDVYEHVYAEPGGVTTFSAVPAIQTTAVTIETDITDEELEMHPLRHSHSTSTNTPPVISKPVETRAIDGAEVSRQTVEPAPVAVPESGKLEMPVRPPRRKTSRSTSPAGHQNDGLQVASNEYAEFCGSGSTPGEKKRDAGGPNEIVACTTCGGNSGSPCTHSANNGCATETCFVQVRKKEPPHPIRIAKTIDVIARITFPTAYAIFLIFFFVHYKGFS